MAKTQIRAHFLSFFKIRRNNNQLSNGMEDLSMIFLYADGAQEWTGKKKGVIDVTRSIFSLVMHI